MTPPIEALIAQVQSATDGTSSGGGTAAADRERLARLAAEFESMLTVQMLRDMRRAGTWGDEESAPVSGGPLFEMLDAQLATHMAKSQGLGIATQVLAAFDRGAARVTSDEE